MILVLPNALFVSATLSFLRNGRVDLIDRWSFFYTTDKQTIEENNYQQLFGYAESVERQRKPMPIRSRSLVKIRRFKMHCC